MLGSAEDKDLVTSSAKGDKRAFEQLYRRHAGQVYGICYRLTLDKALAEDLTQETFVKVWKSLGSFSFESAFGTWLYRIASNTALSHLRSSNKMVLVDEVPEEETSHATDIGANMDVEAQLKRMPERPRVVLILHDVAGMTHEEIGEALGIAPGTSKATLFRARSLFREMTDDHE